MKNDIMVLFWVPYPSEGASNRYRVEQYLPYLKLKNISYVLRPFWSSCAFKVLFNNGYFMKKLYYFILGTIRRIIDLFFLSRYDLVFIHREAYPVGGAFFETILSNLRKPFIFDFDDAIFLFASSPQNNFAINYKNPLKIAKIIKMSNGVIAGNGYLADFALKYNPIVWVVPTSIDTDKYRNNLNKQNKHGDVIIGWIGSVTTLGFLDPMVNVFTRLSSRFPNVKFKIIGGEFSVPGLSNVVSSPWSIERELDDLKTFDIGIMPMPDNEWTRGKCGFKAIIYMSMGIPCVCSAVGVNNEIITNGVNGFLVNAEDEWLDRLSFLINHDQQRREMGARARIVAEENFSVKSNVNRFLKTLEIIDVKNNNNLN